MINPGNGIYLDVSDSSNKGKPKAPDTPNVTIQGDLMVIKWNYEECHSQLIVKYEVLLHSKNSLGLDKGLILPYTPKLRIKSNEDPYLYSMGLGPPRIIAGHKYTIQVRTISEDGGPSNWSKAVECRFKTGPPNKPQKPRVRVNPPQQGITINVKRPMEDDENGSPVRTCIIVRDEQELPLSMDQFPITISAEPDSKFYLKVIMVNEAGRSPPSEAVEVTTPELLPGAPVNVRISSTRKRDSVKVRWDPPDENAEAAFTYEVQIRLSKQNVWFTVRHGVTKLSAKVGQLHSNTKYKFRVRALNNQGHALPGEYSAEVEAETRYGKVVAMLVATGAFGVGALAGLVLEAVEFGGAAGMAAAENVDSEAGSIAAGIAAGVGGVIAGGIVGIVRAPLNGYECADKAYKAVSGELDESPPTSEDESPK